jgi:hypothetical protein
VLDFIIRNDYSRDVERSAWHLRRSTHDASRLYFSWRIKCLPIGTITTRSMTSDHHATEKDCNDFLLAAIQVYIVFLHLQPCHNPHRNIPTLLSTDSAKSPPPQRSTIQEYRQRAILSSRWPPTETSPQALSQPTQSPLFLLHTRERAPSNSSNYQGRSET